MWNFQIHTRGLNISSYMFYMFKLIVDLISFYYFYPLLLKFTRLSVPPYTFGVINKYERMPDFVQ